MRYFILLCFGWFLFAQPLLFQTTKATYHPIAAPPPKPTQKGLYATVPPWDQNFTYGQRFHIVELGGFNDIAQIPQAVRQKFETIVAYEWMAGFYGNEENSFVNYAKAHPNKLLNTQPILGNDFYYDLCDEELQKRRVTYLTNKVHTLKIDGLFFDWANDIFLEEPELHQLKESFSKRHPNTKYADCLEKFLAKLKANNILIITNQAYRNPQLLAHVDYDMCESYMSGFDYKEQEALINGKKSKIPYTYYQPLKEVFSYFDYFHKLQKKYGFTNMIYMNYLAPKLIKSQNGFIATTPIEGIYYNYVLAKLGGFAQYTEVPFDHALERVSLYFYDLGKPLGSIHKEKGLYLRFFSKGFVLLAPKLQTERYILIQSQKSLYDLKEHCKLPSIDGNVTIRLAPVFDTITNRFEPIAKVFLYED